MDATMTPDPNRPHRLQPGWRARGTARTLLWVSLSAVPWCAPALAHDAHHAGHQVDSGQKRSEHTYALPALKVTRADGTRMLLTDAIDDGRPVMLNFVYTSCNAICPVSSQVFVEVRQRLGSDRDRLNMVSISIDPEQDTPRRLTEYASRFGSAGVWAHFTSGSADAVEIQRAFGAWRGDKMNHQPTTFLRSAPGQPWVRLDGFYGPTELVSEYRKTVTTQAADNCAEAARGPAAVPSTAGLRVGLNTRCKS
jgi:protein SCO1